MTPRVKRYCPCNAWATLALLNAYGVRIFLGGEAESGVRNTLTSHCIANDSTKETTNKNAL